MGTAAFVVSLYLQRYLNIFSIHCSQVYIIIGIYYFTLLLSPCFTGRLEIMYGAPFWKKNNFFQHKIFFFDMKYFFRGASTYFCWYETLFRATLTCFCQHYITFRATSNFLFWHKIVFRVTPNVCFGHRLDWCVMVIYFYCYV